MSALGVGLVNYYSFLFARKVVGVVIDVKKIDLTSAILTRPSGDIPYLHSFAVAVRETSGEIVTASAEDRQWAVVKPGQCVEAKYYPYPPWDFEKSGTYFGARLIKLYECSSSLAPNNTNATQ